MPERRSRTRGRLQKVALAALLTFGIAPSVDAFSILAGATGSTIQETLESAPRWSSLSGLDDGIQVGVQANFAAALDLAPGQASLVEQRVRDAFGAWRNPALDFDVTFDAAGTAEGTRVGFEIDLFAVGNSHPVFTGNAFFGFADVDTTAFSARRPLTNGRSFPGFSISGVDIYLNIDNFAFLASLGRATRLDILSRVLIHEIGHGIGLDHPNANDPFGARPNYDTDFDPLNDMAIDPNDPFSNLIASEFRDEQAIMSNGPCGIPALGFCAAAAFSALRPDDVGGRDALYPVVPEPSTGLLIALGMTALGHRRRGPWISQPAGQTSSGVWNGS